MIWEPLGIMFLDIKERAAQQRGTASGGDLHPRGVIIPPNPEFPRDESLGRCRVPCTHPLQEELADAEDSARVGLGSLEQTEPGAESPGPPPAAKVGVPDPPELRRWAQC